MSRSRNTEKIEIKAENKFDIESIKIIQRNPKKDDIHPLNKLDIKKFLLNIPSKYVYKLKVIELRPREGEPGKPWGQYRPSDSKIILYSHPLKTEDGSDYALNMAFASNRSISLLADLEEIDGKWFSVWSKEMLLLFYIEILAHEIGHHYYNVTKFQKKKPVGKFHEVVAESYKDKILSCIEPLAGFSNDKSEKIVFDKMLHEFVSKLKPDNKIDE